MIISVSSPEVHTHWGKAHVTFLVRTEPQQQLVRRRYSDFEWLRQSLTARFIGAVVPPLPGKRGIWGATTHVGKATDPRGDEFVLERMRMLSLFLEACARSAYLRADNVFRQFLAENDERAWEKFKKSCKPGVGAPTEAERRWQRLIRNTRSSESAERIVSDVQRQLDALEKPFKEMHAACGRYAVLLQDGAEAVADVKAAFAGVHDAEAMCGDSTQVECAHKEYAEMRPLFVAAGERLEASLGLRRSEPVMVETLLMDTVKYRLMELHCIRDHFKLRREAVATLAKANAALDKHEREKSALVAKGGRAERVERLDTQIQEDKNAVRRCQYRASFMTKGLVHCEIDRLWQEKLVDYKRMLGAYAAAQLAFANKIRDTWGGFLHDMNMDGDGMLCEARHLMGPMQDIRGATPAGRASGAPEEGT